MRAHPLDASAKPKAHSALLVGRRAYGQATTASSWEEIWEAGPYYQRISELLEGAKRYAVFVGWQVDSRLPLPDPGESLKSKVLRLVEEKPDLQIYFLIWAHAYLYVVEREWWQTRIWEEIHPRIHFVFDNRHPLGGSHHEKLCIIDGRIAFCGGIDLCDERWDSPQHLHRDPRRSLHWENENHGPYHDLAVQVSGPICVELQNHVASRWRTISSIPFPDPPNPLLRKGPHPVYISRTFAPVDPLRKSPETGVIREIEFLYRDLIQSAENRIILEGQYYWSHEINDLLMAQMRKRKGQPFEIYLILAELKGIKSLTRLLSNFELTLIDRLIETARQTGTRLTVGTPYVCAPGFQPRPVYIHSKLLIVDDRFLSIGSANFASRALRVDTEINLTLVGESSANRAHIRRVSRQVLAHWNLLGPDEPGYAHRNSHVHFRRHAPRRERVHRRSESWLPPPAGHVTWIPWHRGFDPALSWTYFFKRKHPIRFPCDALLINGVAIASTWILASLPAGMPAPELFAMLNGALMASVWLLPVPFLGLAAMTALLFPSESSGWLAISAYWVASTLGYFLTRMFPTWASRLYRDHGRETIGRKIGNRSFRALLSAVLDPSFSFRSKIAYQGLYCTPFPWFVLVNYLLIPGGLSVFCFVVERSVPQVFQDAARQNATALILVSAAATLAGVLWERYGKKTPESPVLQHP